MPRLTHSTPSYRRHANGQAVVTYGGRDHYLGKYGSPESRREYDQQVAAWIANGRQNNAAALLTIDRLVLKFKREHVNVEYVKLGQPTSEQATLVAALKPLLAKFGREFVKDFGPLKLEEVRKAMIAAGWARRYINKQISRIRLMFKWAVAKELIDESVYRRLQSLLPLKRGKTEARETPRIQPAPDADVDAVIAALSPSLAAARKMMDTEGFADSNQPSSVGPLLAKVPAESPVAAMLAVQRLTGMRPGEVVQLSNEHLDAAAATPLLVLPHHKNEHHGLERKIPLGPRALAILKPFIDQHPRGPLFRPTDAVMARRTKQRRERRTPVQPSQMDRSKENPTRRPSDQYSTDSYRRAIEYACRKVGCKRFSPQKVLRLLYVGPVRLKYLQRVIALCGLGPMGWHCLSRLRCHRE